MKAYTDLEQSKKLAEILPLESADMVLLHEEPYETSDSKFDGLHQALCVPFNKYDKSWRQKYKNISYFPCWSLAALSEFILPYIADDDGNNYKFYLSKDGLDRWIAYYKSDDVSIHICEESDNMLDVILEMVCWLKKEEYI